MKILLVDDEPSLRELLRATFEGADVSVDEASSGQEAEERIRRRRPDVIVLDLRMPGMGGTELCERLQADPKTKSIPIVLLTGAAPEEARRAQRAGAAALVRKPFSPLDLLAVVQRVAGKTPVPRRPRRVKAADEELLLYARDLRHLLEVERGQRTLLQESYLATVTSLAGALESRDTRTGAHSQRVQRYAVELLEALHPGVLERDPGVRYGFLLHDIGKIAIPDQILQKPGPLTRGRATPDADAHRDRRADAGRRRRPARRRVCRSSARTTSAGTERAIRTGSRGTELPVGARVFAVADALDAMTSDRPYRRARALVRPRATRSSRSRASSSIPRSSTRSARASRSCATCSASFPPRSGHVRCQAPCRQVHENRRVTRPVRDELRGASVTVPGTGRGSFGHGRLDTCLRARACPRGTTSGAAAAADSVSLEPPADLGDGGLCVGLVGAADAARVGQRISGTRRRSGIARTRAGSSGSPSTGTSGTAERSSIRSTRSSSAASAACSAGTTSPPASSSRSPAARVRSSSSTGSRSRDSARMGRDRALLYLALFPMSLFLQAVYSESLYLLCCVGAFFLAERRRWLGAGVVTGLALLTRLAGVALIPPMLLLAWRSPERRRALLSLLPAPALAALYPLWLQLKLHAVFSAFSNEAGWGRHSRTPGRSAGSGTASKQAWVGVKQIATADPQRAGGRAQPGVPRLLRPLRLARSRGLAALRRAVRPVRARQPRDPAERARPCGYPLLSMPRFCLPLFPAFLALAAIANTERRNRAILVVSSLFLGVAVVEWSVGQWVS